MKSLRALVVLVILGIAFFAALYSQRAVILDWYQEATKLELPVAMTYKETQYETEETNTDVVSAQEVPSEEIESTNVIEEDIPSLGEETIEEYVSVDESSVEEFVELKEELVVLPDSVNLAVPFTPQAPDANWNEPYQEMCEEASVYMIERYYAGEPEGMISAEKADADLLEIIAFENELFGDYRDTTAEQVSVFSEMMFGFSLVKVFEDPTVEQIKEHLAAGRPVLVPAAGRLLGNPYFTAPGPKYHMLVLRGYTADNQFITNDPGTRKGEAYLYDFDTILYAMHDWNGGEEITEGKKVIIVIYP